jgi:hypothetical protein
MSSYYCNDAVLELQNVHSMVDLTRQCLELVTRDGAELELVIERVPMSAGTTLANVVEASIAERKRSVRGFELASVTVRDYPEVSGTEARMTHFDKERGPLFFHEFHYQVDATRVVYSCRSRLAQAAICDQWMQATLETLRLR